MQQLTDQMKTDFVYVILYEQNATYAQNINILSIMNNWNFKFGNEKL